MRTWVMPYLTLVTALVLSSGPMPAVSLPDGVPLAQCGINALCASLRYLGSNVGLDELYREIQPDKANQVSLRDLADSARSRGFFVRGERQINRQSLLNYLKADVCVVVQFPYTAGKVQRRHIAAIIPSEEGVVYVDAPIKRVCLADDAVDRLLGGSEGLLLISTSPLGHSHLAAILAAVGFFLGGLTAIKGFARVTVLKPKPSRHEENPGTVESKLQRHA